MGAIPSARPAVGPVEEPLTPLADRRAWVWVGSADAADEVDLESADHRH
jgi:hypothetical protein